MGLLITLFITLMLVFYPLGEITRIPIGEAAISFIDIGVFLLVSVWIFRKIAHKAKIKGELLKPISIFICALLISLFFNFRNLTINEFFISFLYLVRWIFYSLIYFVVKDFSKSFKNYLPYFLKISGLLVIVIGFIFYLFYPDLRNLRYLGWDEHLYRNFSSFLDPNFAGVFFVLFFVLVSSSLNMNKLKSKFWWFDIILSFLSVISILITFSRSAYITFVVAVLSLAILKKQLKFILLIILFMFVLILLPNFTLKSEGTNLLREASGKARIDSIRNALTIFKDNPILGVGFDSYRYAQRRYGFVKEDKMLVHSAAGTDNSYLFIMATTGAIGFLFFTYFLFNLFKFSVGSNILLVSLIAVCVDSFFINSLFYSPIMLWVWILAGLRENT